MSLLSRLNQYISMVSTQSAAKTIKTIQYQAIFAIRPFILPALVIVKLQKACVKRLLL